MEALQKSPPRVKLLASKDLIILLKKLLVTLALYLIPVLLVWAALTLVGQWTAKDQPPTAPKATPIRVVDA